GWCAAVAPGDLAKRRICHRGGVDGATIGEMAMPPGCLRGVEGYGVGAPNELIGKGGQACTTLPRRTSTKTRGRGARRAGMASGEIVALTHCGCVSTQS